MDVGTSLGVSVFCAPSYPTGMALTITVGSQIRAGRDR